MSTSAEFLRGMRRSVPIIIASVPFGILFGAVAVANGLTPAEAILMSATIFAGASQMVGIELFGTSIAPWLIVLSIFAVNFRHVLYSAAVGRRVKHWSPAQRAFGFFFLVDPAFAECERRSEEGRIVTFAWFMGIVLPLYASFVAAAWVGAIFGRLISNPYALGLDFMLSIYFLGLVMEFRGRPLWLPVVAVSAVVSVVAFHTVGSPWHVSIGAIAGIALAAIVSGSGATEIVEETETVEDPK